MVETCSSQTLVPGSDIIFLFASDLLSNTGTKQGYSFDDKRHTDDIKRKGSEVSVMYIYLLLQRHQFQQTDDHNKQDGSLLQLFFYNKRYHIWQIAEKIVHMV